jgi:thiamine-monophosphate kinase
MNEFELIDLIRAACALRRDDVVVGIGDDAAVTAVPAGCELVACTDTLVAGRHFPLNTRPEDIGWKSLAVNLSDLAAMGAAPAFALLALSLPDADAGFVRAFARGFAELAARHDVALVGGDTTRGPLTITVTAFGFVPSGTALRRAGAQVGDVVALCGSVGGAAAGLRYLGSHPDCGRAYRLQRHRTEHQWVDRLDRPQPQVACGLALRGHASSAIDVSDGLAADLGHLLRAGGVGADLALASIPGHAEIAEHIDIDTATRLVLGGGDDYVLLATLPESALAAAGAAVAAAGGTLTPIGRIVAEAGLRVADANGHPVEIAKPGWDHFG